MENKGTIMPMVKRLFFEKPKRLEKKELTPLQIEFKEKCKKYPIIAVFTEYNGETPYFVGPPKFAKVRENIENNESGTVSDYDVEWNWIPVDELDIEPSHGGDLKTLPICEITSYDEVNKCYTWGKTTKVKFYQEVHESFIKKCMSEAILILFKDYKDIREWGTEYLLPIARRDDYSQYFYSWSDTHYKLGLMERSTTIGYYADDVYFVNCSIDDCKDEEFFRDLQVMKKWGTKVHYDPKDTEELQSKLKMIDAKWKLYDFRAIGELRCYKQEETMKKLNEEFALKQYENVMEICKEILEQYENGTLEEFLKN